MISAYERTVHFNPSAPPDSAAVTDLACKAADWMVIRWEGPPGSAHLVITDWGGVVVEVHFADMDGQGRTPGPRPSVTAKARDDAGRAVVDRVADRLASGSEV